MVWYFQCARHQRRFKTTRMIGFLSGQLFSLSMWSAWKYRPDSKDSVVAPCRVLYTKCHGNRNKTILYKCGIMPAHSADNSKTVSSFFGGLQFMLFWIKAVHTAVFVLMACSVMYVLYSGITGTTGLLTWIALSLIVLEALTFTLNKCQCPLTQLSERYGAENGTVSSMFLPRLCVPHAINIFTLLGIVGILLLSF